MSGIIIALDKNNFKVNEMNTKSIFDQICKHPFCFQEVEVELRKFAKFQEKVWFVQANRRHIY